MAPVRTVIPGRRSTTPTVPQSSPAVPWRDDRSPSGRWRNRVSTGDGRRRSLPCHLDREPILPIRPGPRTSDATATRAAEKGVGKDVDRERELRLGGTCATWRTCRNPSAPTRTADPAGGNGSHHALLRPPTS